MELAHLVRAVTFPAHRARTWRLLARFLVAGALLFAARRAVWPESAAPRPLTVTVPASANAADLQAIVDEAILVDIATQAGWARSDAVVRERLLASLAVVEGAATSPNATVDRAIALGLHRTDAIARRRLASAARRAVERSGSDPPPSLQEASSEIAAHPERYRLPARLRFHQIFLSAARRGASLDADAAAMLARLHQTSPAPLENLTALSDPWPWGGTGGTLSTDRLDALYGDGFGSALERAEPHTWVGPIRSAFGRHFVQIEERQDGRLPTAQEAFARASEEILSERRQKRFETRMSELRRRYQIRVERKP